MVAHGVTRARLPARNDVVCTLHDARVAALAEKLGTTRSAAALELWQDRLGGAVVAIGNAPTALFRLLEMLDAGAPRPAAILGIPVGFVGAAEAKDALAANPRGVPFLTVRGRMGGSAMTAAADQRAGKGRTVSAAGKLVGVGVGPGDPELITLKAVRVLEEADVVVHFAKSGTTGNARAIAQRYLRPGIRELPLTFPVTTELPKDEAAYCDMIGAFYDAAATELAAHLDDGRVVAVVCEGDPLFYGSYMHLHVRLARRFHTEVVAGVSGMSGCWSAVGTPIAQGDDVFTVLPGTLAQDELERRLVEADAVVVMKLGRNLPKVRRALERTGRLTRAVYVERGTMAGEKAIPLADKPDDCAPYFAIVLVPGWEGRS